MMSTTSIAHSAADAESSRTKFAAYVTLTKPRISVMVLLTVGVTALIADPSMGSLWSVMCAVIGTFFIAASGSAMNQYLERYSDFMMKRTAGRPLPAHDLSASEVAIFGAMTLGAGLVVLASTVNWMTTGLGLATWVLYVVIYTPMKTRTWLNTVVGAVAGAMPILMGYTAVMSEAWQIPVLFFTVLFFWQFPHFMAIAWKYREDYADGGLVMLTVTDPSGKSAGILSIATAIALWVVSLIPVFYIDSMQIVFVVVSSGLALAYLYFSINFARERNDFTAKKLLRSSLLYLPLYMILLSIVCLS